jgi:predicted tellurium resistance membrane protein TerC
LAHRPLFHIPAFGPARAASVSGRDLILLCGGLFLLWKSTREIHDKLEGEDGVVSSRVTPKFANVVIQILLLDIVFSLDSVITAVGMARHLGVMIAAVIIALIFMLIFAGRIGDFIHRHPTLKILALSFLLLIGCALVAEGFHKEIPKGYIYFAMAFSVGVECLNLRLRARQDRPLEFHQPATASRRLARHNAAQARSKSPIDDVTSIPPPNAA